MPTKMLEKLRRRIIKNFMDILILTELRKDSLSGYDIISLIHKRYGILMSSGTVYSLLYSMERHGLIKGSSNMRKRVYKLTEKGEKTQKLSQKQTKKSKNF